MGGPRGRRGGGDGNNESAGDNGDEGAGNTGDVFGVAAQRLHLSAVPSTLPCRESERSEVLAAWGQLRERTPAPRAAPWR